MNNRPLIMLVGKSGSGKTTIAECLEKYYGMKMLESYTTREPRYENEKGHTFITYNEYLTLPNKVGTTYFRGRYYCCTQEQCDTSDVYVVDPDGVKTFMRNYKGNRRHIIFYIKINPIIRLWRMINRGDGIFESVKRIIHDHKKFGKFEKERYVHILKRDTVSNMCKEIYSKAV